MCENTKVKSLLEESADFSTQVNKFSMIFRNPKYEEEYAKYKYERKNILLAIGICIFFNALFQALRQTQLWVSNFLEPRNSPLPRHLAITIVIAGNGTYILEGIIFFIPKLRLLRGFIISVVPVATAIYSSYQVLTFAFPNVTVPFYSPVTAFYLATGILGSFIYSANWICGALQILLITASVDTYLIYFDWSWVTDKPFLLAISFTTAICLILGIYYFEYFQRKAIYMRLEAEVQKQNLENILQKLPDPLIISQNGNIKSVNEVFDHINFSENDISNSMRSINSVSIEKELNDTDHDIHRNSLSLDVKVDTLISKKSKLSFGDIIRREDNLDKERFQLSSENSCKQYFQISSIEFYINTKKYFLYLLNNLTNLTKIRDLKIKEKCQRLYFSSITHDFRTPLGIIMGNIEMLLEIIKDLPISKYLMKIFNATSLLSLLVQDILDFAQMKQGKMTLDPQEFNIDKEFSMIIDLFEDKYKDKGLYLKLEINENLNKILFNDANRIKQILVNLISNAYKFTTQGGVTVRVDPMEASFDLVQVSVIDTGIGIPKEEKKYLFSEFGKLKSNISMNPKGVGLGLYICKQLVQKLGGKIKVKSKCNIGTTFSFSFLSNFNLGLQINIGNTFESKEGNIVKEVNKYLQNDEIKPSMDLFPKLEFRRNSIETFIIKENEYEKHCNCSDLLIIDDDIGIRDILKNFADRLSIRYDEANNGIDGLKKVRAKLHSSCCKWYKVILTDNNMPEMDGIQMSIQIKKELAEIPECKCHIILVSGITNEEKQQIDQLPSSPFTLILPKPLPLNKFKEVVQLYLK